MGLTRPRAHQLQDSDYKQSVRLAQATNVTLSGGAPATVDGSSLGLKDRVLVLGQTDASENGIYTVSVVGSGSNGTWVRASDADHQGDMTSGLTVKVTEGTAHDDTTWKLTTDDPITLGSTDLAFELASAYAFGQVNAGGTTLTADQVNDLLTLSGGTNITVTGDAGTDTATIATVTAPTFTGNVTVGNLITGAQVVATGNITGGNLITTALTSTQNLTVLASGTVEFNQNTLGNIADPVADQDAATKNYVDTSLSSVFTVSDGSTTQVIADGDTLTFAGTTNEVTVAVSATDTVTIGLPDDVTLAGGLTATTTVAATGNVSGGNLNTGAQVVATGNITGGNLISNAGVDLLSRGELKFYDADSSNYVSLRAGSTVASDIVFTLPVQDGTSGQVLQTDGSRNLSFVTASGGGGASGYQTSTITTHPSAGGDDKSLGTGADNVTEETPFEAGGTDPFGVSLGIVYDQMEPIGSFVTIDLGDEEAHVGA